MAGPAELPKRSREPAPLQDLPPNVRAFAVAAAVAADILREIPAGDWAKIGHKSALDPTSVLTKELRATVRAHRDELIEALPPQPAESSVQAELDLANATVIATRERLGAVLSRSPRFGAVWLALESSMVAELVAEEADWVKLGDPAQFPVLSTEDVARLRGKSEQMIRATLAILATFPAARVMQ